MAKEPLDSDGMLAPLASKVSKVSKAQNIMWVWI
jgi:hypothetical protein